MGIESIYFPIEFIAAMAVFTAGLKKRTRFGLRIIAALGAVAVFVGEQYLFTFMIAKAAAGDFRFVYIGTGAALVSMIVLMTLVVWMLFQVTFREAVYCITCVYLTEHIAYCIRLILTGLTGSDMAQAGHLLYYVIHISVYVAAYFVFARHMVKDGHYVTSALQSAGLMGAVLFIVLVMSMVATEQGFELIHGVYALFCCIFVLYSQLKQQKALNLQIELSAREQMWTRARAQYEMSKETIDIINRKCHDLKHQVAALRTISDLDYQGRVIDEIEDSVMIYDSMLKTGNEILDTVLTEKSLLCTQEHIVMTCIADGRAISFMDAVDLYTLFGNALDNAIEAVKELPEEERAVSLLVHEKAGLIFIQAENKYSGEIRMKDGIPQTKKADQSYHGFGMRSMIQIIQKYNGFVTIETEGGIFLLRLTIPKDGIIR